MEPLERRLPDTQLPSFSNSIKQTFGYNRQTNTVRRQPGVNPESPRTRAMWEDYEVSDFPLAADETSPMGPIFKRLKVMARSAGDDSA